MICDKARCLITLKRKMFPIKTVGALSFNEISRKQAIHWHFPGAG